MAYILPQLRVFQEFGLTPNDVTQDLNPVIIGPNYELIRYSDEDRRAECTHASYVGDELVLEWATGLTGSKPDHSWFDVTLVNAYAEIGTIGTAEAIDVENYQHTKFEIELPMTEGDNPQKTSLTGEGGPLSYGVVVKPGDYAGYLVDGELKFSKILDITPGLLEEDDTNVVVRDTVSGDVSSLLDVDVTNYTGEKSGTIKVAVTDGKVTFTSSLFKKVEVSGSIGDDPVMVALGITVKSATSGTPVPNGNYTVAITLVAPYSRDTITLADDLTDADGAAISPSGFYRLEPEVALDSSFTIATDAGVTISPAATIKVGSNDLPVKSATAYLTQRNLITSNTDGVYDVTASDITTDLGVIDPSNPLAYGAYIMSLNCANRPIRYIALKSDDMDGYNDALKRASVTTSVYAFCPLTEDRAIIDTVVAHCKTMSAPENKSWRISFFSYPTPQVVDVTPTSTGTEDGNEQCKIGGTGVNLNKILTCYTQGTNDVSLIALFTETVKEGDKVTITLDNAEPFVTTVARVISNTALLLADAVEGATGLLNFKIAHTRGEAEYVSAIAATSTGFHSHRAYNVWPNHLKNADGIEVSGMYAAAAVCALACSVAPQQPITNVEINGFTDVQDAYSRYSREQLNEIASGGTLIIMQDKQGGEVYVRHQISTAYSDGNLNTTELSLIKNLDSISFYLANLFAPYIGRYNLTDDLLEQLRAVLEGGLTHLETATETNKLIGPQVIAEGTEIVSLAIDAVEKDHAYANVNLNLPKPFNNFDLHLQVI